MVPVSRLPNATRPSTASDPWAPMAPVWRISESTPVPSSPQRSRQPTMMKLAMSDEPPWLMKGSVMPVRGMRRVTPPTMINACSTMMEVRPTAVNELTSDFARAAVTMPRMAKHKYSSSTPAAPSRPVSSAMTGKMKSLSATGMPPCATGSPPMPRPMPVPNRSPSAME